MSVDNPAVDAVMARLTTKRLDPDSHAHPWKWNLVFSGLCQGITTREFVAERLAQGYKVKAGYTTTHNRFYHDKWILTRSK